MKRGDGKKRNAKGFVQGVCVWFDPRTVTAMDQAAAAAGLRRSEWLRRLVVRALGGNLEASSETISAASSPKGRQLALPLPTKAPKRSR